MQERGLVKKRSGRTWMMAMAAALCAAVAASAAEAGVVTLWPSATCAAAKAGDEIRLGDVARLEGEDAAALGGVVVAVADAAAERRNAIEIDLPAVRKALDGAGVNWGRLALHGSTCLVRLGGAGEGQAAAEVKTVAPRRVHEVVEVEGRDTIRARIARDLARHFGVAPLDLRLLFDARDEDLLLQSERGRRVEAQVGAGPNSARVPVTIRVYESQRIVLERTLRVEAEVRVQAVVLAADARRGEILQAEALRTEWMWMAPGLPIAPSVEGAAGSKARTRLAMGTVLRLDHLESPVIVKRGDLVTVKCLSGSVALTAKARAQADARVGDLIELQLDGAEKAFLARIDGPGRAVADLDQAQRGGAGGAS